MTTTHVRSYSDDDRDAVLAVFDSNVPDFFTAAERPAFEAFLDELPGPYFVLETPAGEIVACGGYAIVSEARRADLCWGMVSRAHHGQGLGRALTELRIHHARSESGLDHVIMNTSQHTRAFYEKLGFVTERVTPNGFAQGLDRCDMRLNLR